MGIYVEGMNMPESCRKCELFINCDDCEGQETRCAVLGPIGYLNEIPNDFRHQNCPCVEVKVPHEVFPEEVAALVRREVYNE